MRVELAAHDESLTTAIEAHGGWMFKHTGDGVCAAFWSAADAVAAAVEAQAGVGLPVRMGIATGTAELRGDDYFGPALNRAARVMAAGHGGQILVAASSAGLVDGFDLVDLGEYRLRGLSGGHRLFQVRAEGLGVEFPPLRTLGVLAGNLPLHTTSFVGRATEIEQVAEEVNASRLVTLTGVGGVGKTRLALQVAEKLASEFADGVWLAELAPLGDPAALPDVVATALGVIQQPGLTVSDSVAEALSGRRVLLVLDNCEHVLDAAAELVETILARTAAVRLIATSREGLRLEAERLWPVPSLDVGADGGGAAVGLFVERARAVAPGFGLDDEDERSAVTEICRRLDGIALAIELAASRMMSMNPVELLDRLSDRFRLLAGGRRRTERHQTLRHVVQWSYDLLAVDERDLLNRCAVFAGGFDLAAAAALYDSFDQYALLDVLESLVRKSLMTTEQVNGRTRYGLLETIRQFAEEQLDATTAISEVRDRHARYFAAQALAYFDMWDSPAQRRTLDWVDTEFANLRAGFGWAAEQGDLDTATAIAAHTTWLGWVLQRLEAAGWAEEILDAASHADVAQLPRLFVAAAFCGVAGRIESAIDYISRATALETDPGYEPIETGWTTGIHAAVRLLAGQLDRSAEIYADLASRSGMEHAVGLAGLTWVLPPLGRGDEARAIADEAVAAARAHGNPFIIGMALYGYGRSWADTDPRRALRSFHEGLEYARQNRLVWWESAVSDIAGLEALHGELDQALALFESTIGTCHRAGNHTNLGIALANLAVFFHRIGDHHVATTIYGASTRYTSIPLALALPDVVTRLQAALGETEFHERVATGLAMEPSDAVHHALQEIRFAHQRPDAS